MIYPSSFHYLKHSNLYSPSYTPTFFNHSYILENSPSSLSFSFYFSKRETHQNPIYITQPHFILFLLQPLKLLYNHFYFLLPLFSARLALSPLHFNFTIFSCYT
ncbi:hypothetical protein V8G54_035038, partial [Vigna mungo]